MKVNDIMEEEEQGNQIIMVHGKPMKVKDVLEEIKRKTRDKEERLFSEG